MDKKLVKKSCKVCVALLIGVIVGYGVSKLLEKDNKDNKGNKGDEDEVKGVQPSCGCSS